MSERSGVARSELAWCRVTSQEKQSTRWHSCRFRTDEDGRTHARREAPALRVEHFSADDSSDYDDKMMINPKAGEKP